MEKTTFLINRQPETGFYLWSWIAIPKRSSE